MATRFEGRGSFVANLAVSAFRGVILSNNGGVTYSGDAQIPMGFTETDAASGDYVAVNFFNSGGTQKCQLTASPVTVNDVLYAGALGRVSSTGTVTVGRAMTTTGGAANAANTQVVEFHSLTGGAI